MKVKDIIIEAQIVPGIKSALTKKGYRYIAGGQDQAAYFAPDGTILKIFGTAQDASAGQLSQAQQSIVDFAQYCLAHPSNPFLPEFGGVERFEFDGKYYLQISTERLFDFRDQQARWLSTELESLASYLETNSVQAAQQLIHDELETDEGGSAHMLVLYLGSMDRLMLLLQTIHELRTIADQKNYSFDLHEDNFMLSSDGDIVINDPFYVGN